MVLSFGLCVAAVLLLVGRTVVAAPDAAAFFWLRNSTAVMSTSTDTMTSTEFITAPAGYRNPTGFMLSSWDIAGVDVANKIYYWPMVQEVRVPTNNKVVLASASRMSRNVTLSLVSVTSGPMSLRSMHPMWDPMSKELRLVYIGRNKTLNVGVVEIGQMRKKAFTKQFTIPMLSISSAFLAPKARSIIVHGRFPDSNERHWALIDLNAGKLTLKLPSPWQSGTHAIAWDQQRERIVALISEYDKPSKADVYKTASWDIISGGAYKAMKSDLVLDIGPLPKYTVGYHAASDLLLVWVQSFGVANQKTIKALKVSTGKLAWSKPFTEMPLHAQVY